MCIAKGFRFPVPMPRKYFENAGRLTTGADVFGDENGVPSNCADAVRQLSCTIKESFFLPLVDLDALRLHKTSRPGRHRLAAGISGKRPY